MREKILVRIGWNSQQTNVKKLRQVAVLIMVDDDKQVGFRKCPLSCDPLRRGRTVRHAALGSLSLSSTTMASVTWHYVLKFIITGAVAFGVAVT